MTTTSVFVEILVAGVQSMVWIALLTLAVFGIDWLPSSNNLVNLDSFMILVGFGFSYSFGIINDRMARAFFHIFVPQKLINLVSPLHERMWGKVDVDPLWDKSRMGVMIAERKVTEFLDFIRSRARLARATFFNTVLTMLSAWTLIHVQPNVIWDKPTSDVQWNATFIVLGVGTAILGAAFISYAMLSYNYDLRKTQAKRAYDRLGLTTDDESV